MTASLVTREMLASDPPVIAAAFAAQGWDKPLEQYQRYWQEHLQGRRLVLVAERAGEFAGYGTIIWESDYPPFREAGIPEIMDLNVLIKFRRLGIASALLEEAERRIQARGRIPGLGVGLLRDYGPAQVLYARRGYVPDGHGISYNGRFPEHGEMVRVDDDLCLYLVREKMTFR
jgi:GNAT superfamily N-acetyltransferase